MVINKVYLSKSVIEVMKDVILSYGNNTEVGGCLVGCEINGEILVTHASPPGPNAKRRRYSIDIDNKFTTKFSNELNKHSNNKLYYLGDWHTHLSSDIRASTTDIRALKKLNDYVPIQYRNTIISLIMNHFEPIKYKVYQFNEMRSLIEIPSEIVEDPEWLDRLH